MDVSVMYGTSCYPGEWVKCVYPLQKGEVWYLRFKVPTTLRGDKILSRFSDVR